MSAGCRYWLEVRGASPDGITIYLHKTRPDAVVRAGDEVIDEDATTLVHAARELQFYRLIVDDLNASMTAKERLGRGSFGDYC